MPSSSLERSSSNADDETPRKPGDNSSAVVKIIAAPLRPIRPLLPHLLPFIVCLLSIPVLVFLSGAAGWMVWKNVPVGWTVDANLQYGEAANPFATAKLPQIHANQPYDVTLHLVVPATESNFALGNFMTTLRLATAYNETITTVRRSATLIPPRPSLIKQAVWGYSSLVNIDIPLLYQFTTGTSDVTVRLEIGRSDGWRPLGTGQGRELTVVEATLKGTIRPTGLRAILMRYPRLTTFISSFSFFFISIIVVTTIIFSAMGSLSPTASIPDDSSSVGGDSDGGDSSYPKARRVSKRDLSDERSDTSSVPLDEKPFKPSDSGQATRLRKRRSQPGTGHTHTTSRGQIKIEVDDTPSLHTNYPKSPFPHQDSQDSVSPPPKELIDVKTES